MKMPLALTLTLLAVILNPVHYLDAEDTSCRSPDEGAIGGKMSKSLDAIQQATFSAKERKALATLSGISRKYALTGKLDENFDWVEFRLANADGDYSSKDKKEALERWRKNKAKYKRIAERGKGTGGLYTVREIVSQVVKDYLADSDRDQGNLIDALMGKKANCNVQTQLIFAALTQSGVKPPDDCEFGLQSQPYHAEFVALCRPPEGPKLVQRLIVPEVVEGVEAEIFHPAAIFEGYLKKKAPCSPSSIDSSDLKTASIDPDMEEKLHKISGGNPDAKNIKNDLLLPGNPALSTISDSTPLAKHARVSRASFDGPVRKRPAGVPRLIEQAEERKRQSEAVGSGGIGGGQVPTAEPSPEVDLRPRPVPSPSVSPKL